MIRLIALFCLAEFEAFGQTNPVAAQFERLMGQPKQIVNALVNFPWKPEAPDELPGLRQVPPGPSLRVASVEQAPRTHSRWTHWESGEGDVWADLVDSPNPMARPKRCRHRGSLTPVTTGPIRFFFSARLANAGKRRLAPR